ncbi:nucleoside-diphosphate kinase [Candidatus Woesearchaeota archaeon]|nr:nucleoside-diphosphate kinase [Candidatus Woesearchaeota archaeon]
MIERTLVVIKPDGVERSLSGKILTRFEDAGLKIVGLKMVWVDRKMALRHYTEDLAKRRGEHVRRVMVDYISTGPVVAAVIEGVNAVEVVRKITGDTEPRAAAPGTIRGDFTHVSFKYADSRKAPVKNVIHASSDAADAKREIALWFSGKELYQYKSVHDAHLQ